MLRMTGSSRTFVKNGHIGNGKRTDAWWLSCRAEWCTMCVASFEATFFMTQIRTGGFRVLCGKPAIERHAPQDGDEGEAGVLCGGTRVLGEGTIDETGR